jgi:crotonobetainyl-CoA:carnitine CoA-transferase CaiB-like acyl-CoA transferase
MLLADLGADVVKVEPVSGDAMRYVERCFCGVQRGKRSVALQLGDPRSKAALEALVRWADVAHYNVRMPAARKLGIDPQTLASINPNIISCHVSSYGPLGPRADWPGYDQMFQASCGWEVENGGEGNSPLWLRFGVADYFGAASSLFGVLLAIYHRDRTGSGQTVTASLLAATIWSTAETLVYPDGRIAPFAHLNAEQTGISSEQRIYRCADQWIAVAATQLREVAAFRHLAQDNPAGFLSSLPAQEAAARLEAAGVPCEIVSADQYHAFLDSPDNRASGLVTSCEHVTYGRLEQIGSFWNFGNLPVRLDREPPTIGQHSREVLIEVGVSEAAFEQMQREGVTLVSTQAGIDASLNKRR